ncbi:MAG: DNA-3-methyladenine glycosylase 2 family protein [Euryarchaeota archaeon]|nr:DNA-3-methyladenine glycosylase 2 family protein [Euryarchaeota archaeon]
MARAESFSTSGPSFLLTPRGPFHLGRTVWALRRRPHNRMDLWDGKTYRRLMLIQGQPARVEVRSLDGRPGGPLSVQVIGVPATREVQAEASRALEGLLGVHIDLAPFYRLARRDPRLHELVLRFKGAKPPRFPSVFEALANGIACQQLSLNVGIELLNRLSQACGPSLEKRSSTEHAFPRPEDVLGLELLRLRKIGFSRKKSMVLRELSRAVDKGSLKLDALEHMDNRSVVELLDAIPGVGRWTAEYTLLRGLGRLDTYPGDDVGARNRLARWLGRRDPLDYEGVTAVTRRWQPFAGVVYFHMLLAGLSDSGVLA